MKLSPHVSFREVVRSTTALRRGIENNPNQLQLDRIKLLCLMVFEPLRNHFDVPIFIASCFRSNLLNHAIGGAAGSQHMANRGAAMDLDADVFGGITNADIFFWLMDNADFDQLIWEFGNDHQPDWVHVSYHAGNNRRQVLKAVHVDGRTRYRPLIQHV